MRLTTSYTIPLLGLTATTFILQHGSSALFYNGVCAFTTSSSQLSSYRSKGPIANRHVFAVNDDDDGHQLLVQPDNANDDNNKQQQRDEDVDSTTSFNNNERWRIASILGGIATSQLHVTKVCKSYTSTYIYKIINEYILIFVIDGVCGGHHILCGATSSKKLTYVSFSMYISLCTL